MKSTVGQNIPRVDGPEKVTGRAVYASDLKLPDMAHAKILRSPLPHARIRRIAVHRALAVPGVLAVLTRENLGVNSPYYGAYIKDQPIVALEKVRYAGDTVAAVAAVDEATAERAVREIEVDYEELPAIFTVEEALAKNAPLIHDERPERKDPRYGRGASHLLHDSSNIFFHFRYERGACEEGFAQADFVFEDTFSLAGMQHYPMEPQVSVAHFQNDRVMVWSSTQTPFPLRQELSRIFGLPLSRVRVIVPYVGGGYGAKSGLKTEALAVALSRLAHRPVRVSLSADETFKTLCDPGASVVIRTGVNRDGTFVARKCEVYFNGGAYANSGPTVTERAGYRAHGPYRIPHVRSDAYCVYTNTVPAGAFRGFGGPQVSFAYESQLDMIARRLKMDPVDLRMKNLLHKGEDYTAGNIPIDCDLKGELRLLADTIGWNNKEGRPGREVGPGRRRGKGMACAVKDGGGVNKEANAMVKILVDGSVLLFLGSVEIGQGVRTVLLQVVADELSVTADAVQVAELDTQSTPFDRGTHASSAVTVMGRAVQNAAADARAQFLSAAAHVFVKPESAIELAEGKARCGGKSLSFRDVMRGYFGDVEGEIIGRGAYKVPRVDEAPLGYPATFWENGLGAAEVEVDEMTGEVKILKYVSITDSGKMIHPLHCRGQDEGAVMFGIGHALSEQLVYQDGELINPNLMDYRLPRFRDLPQTLTSIVLEEGGGSGPYGSKGMGEGGTLAVTSAVCNAVYNAVGARLQQVPLTGERVWEALQKRANATKGEKED